MGDVDDNMTTDEGSVCRIVKAFVSHNRVQSADLAGLIFDVHLALAGLRNALPRDAWAAELPARSEDILPRIRRSLPDRASHSLTGSMPTPDEIRRSITETHLISFEDGKPYAMLKRHLTFRGLTPQQYRAKWGLPADYPMVAAHYTIKRSELARRTGLGHKKTAKGQPVNRSQASPRFGVRSSGRGGSLAEAYAAAGDGRLNPPRP